MGRIEKHGKDAIAQGVDAKPGRKFQAGPGDHTPPAEANARPGTLAEALENSSWKPKVPNRYEDTTVDAASLTDVDGNRKPSHLYLAAALEENYRKHDREGGR